MRSNNEDSKSLASADKPPDAEHLFVLMKRRFRISRNVRAQWYFHNLNQIVRLEDESELVRTKKCY